MTFWKLASKMLHSFNTLSSSPLAFHQVQKPNFPCQTFQPFGVSTGPETQLLARPTPKLCLGVGKPKPHSDLGFKVLRIEKNVRVQSKKNFHSIKQELTAPLHATQICRIQ